jgi:integrase
VFPFFYGHPGEASKYFRRFADLCGSKATVHHLRHTSATWMLQNKVPIKEVSLIMGHSDVKTTEIYTDLLADDLREGINTIEI